jgi:hypothetical protein
MAEKKINHHDITVTSPPLLRPGDASILGIARKPCVFVGRKCIRSSTGKYFANLCETFVVQSSAGK